MSKYDHAYNVSCSIVTDLPFDEIPIETLVEMMLHRLEKVQETEDREAFECFDTVEEGMYER